MPVDASDTSPNRDTGSIEAATEAFARMLDPEGATGADADQQPKRTTQAKTEAKAKAKAPKTEAEGETSRDDGTDADDDGDLEGDADTADDTADDDSGGADDDADDDAETDDDGDPEGEDDADDEGAEEAKIDPDTLVTVKIDGKESKVRLSEAIAGYQRQADYSQKTAELAEARKVLATEFEAVRAERAQYAQLLTALDQQLKSSTEPDWAKLKADDPVEFAIKRLEWQELQERRAAVQAEQERLAAVSTQEQQAAFQRMVQEERKKLLDAVPAWRDEKVWERDREALRAYGRKIGFSDDELSQATDSRAIVILQKAMKYDRLMAKKANGKQVPPKASAPAPAPLKAGSSNKPPAKVTARNEAMKRLAKTGSVQDAAKVFEHLI